MVDAVLLQSAIITTSIFKFPLSQQDGWMDLLVDQQKQGRCPQIHLGIVFLMCCPHHCQ